MAMNPVITIQLTPGEMCLGSFVGGCRQASNRANGSQHRHGTPPGDAMIAADISGAQAEIAVCRHFNLSWTGSLNLKAPDVGGLIDVRSTMTREKQLIIREDDPEERPYVLVWAVGQGCFELVGWLRARAAKQAEYRREQRYGGEAFYFPYGLLNNIEDLEKDLLAMGAPLLRAGR
jgi:hypothetical protein